MATPLGGYAEKTFTLATATALAASSTPVQTGVRVKVIAATSKTVYVGNNASVTTGNGYPIIGGDAESFDVGFFGGDLANLYFAGSEAGLTVGYWYV